MVLNQTRWTLVKRSNLNLSYFDPVFLHCLKNVFKSPMHRQLGLIDVIFDASYDDGQLDLIRWQRELACSHDRYRPLGLLIGEYERRRSVLTWQEIELANWLIWRHLYGRKIGCEIFLIHCFFSCNSQGSLQPS